ncbi:8959_t:CDS:2 [Funneliformis mosseae]|uniref:NOL1/NOP2/Sun domain family member 4 n=1 Tax=Funneliformis mosseae TaxID=27381 RepID=A0A9N8ZDX1_FUNMO|nr:8959_t:CDS:2 [Funneliformis mosseae]
MPQPSIIPRKVLFGNPSRASPTISPDGKYLAFIAPKDGILNIYVCDNPRDISSARAITNDKHRGIRTYMWSFSNRIIYKQDKDDFKVYSVDVNSGEEILLTPFDKTTSTPERFSSDFPDEIVISINHPDPTAFSLYRSNLKTGEINLIEENTQGFIGYFVNDDLKVRFATKQTDEAGNDVYRKINDEWELMISYDLDDTISSEIKSLVKDDKDELVYLTDSRDREFNALYKINLNDPKKKLHLVVDPKNQKSDIEETLLDPRTNVPLAYSLNYLRKSWHPICSEVSKDLDFLKSVDEGDISFLSQTLDNTIWIVGFENDTRSAMYYLYERSERSVHLLFNQRPELDDYELVKLHPVVIKSRDNLDLVSYLTVPLKKHDPYTNYKPTHPLPMILAVHGGPWIRDYFTPLRGDHQFFANRGYAVLSVNYRSSTGLGKTLLRSGNGEWGGKAHDDLIDAINWAIKEKIALKDKIAIYGGSYGGYAVLAGLTFTPGVFAAGVDIVGPSNLVTLLKSIPPYWKAMLNELKKRVGGDPETEEGVKFLSSRSPLNFADKICKPLLIAQVSKSIPVDYVLFNDEGHGFARPENRISFFAMTEKFLSVHLGGRYEEVQVIQVRKSELYNDGDDKENSLIRSSVRIIGSFCSRSIKKLNSITELFNNFYIQQYGKERWPNLLSSLKGPSKSCAMINKFASNTSILEFIHESKSSNNSDMMKVDYLGVECYVSDSKFPKPKKDEHNIFNVYHLDLASIMVTKALDVQPGDMVLDLCAAPGGKSLAILQRLLNNVDQRGGAIEGSSTRESGGMLIANEINNKRFHRLLQVIKSYIPFKYHQDQIKLVKNSPTRNFSYDKILVDVPCSSERHLITDQNELSRWKESRSKNFSIKQYNILLDAVKALRINGILVYSTCSISNLENDLVIKKILENSWVELQAVKRNDGWEFGEETGFGWIVLPDKCDGYGPMYFTILKRVEKGNKF